MTEPARILLAKDEERSAGVLHDLLCSHGFQVTVCTDGLAAWEHLQGDRPGYDVVLLDRGLRHMDGMELLRRIKNAPGFARIPVIMEIENGDMTSIREALNHGAYNYLTRPFQPEVLLALLNAAQQQGREYRNKAEGARRAELPKALLHIESPRFGDREEGAEQ
jgi:DNA-binding response OmpR family regulator